MHSKILLALALLLTVAAGCKHTDKETAVKEGFRLSDTMLSKTQTADVVRLPLRSEKTFLEKSPPTPTS